METFLCNPLLRIAPCASTERELSFECSYHRISSADSKVRVIPYKVPTSSLAVKGLIPKLTVQFCYIKLYGNCSL